jgi:FtsP/CotA-like multicopper oxidase with cupredoxin domain
MKPNPSKSFRFQPGLIVATASLGLFAVALGVRLRASSMMSSPPSAPMLSPQTDQMPMAGTGMMGASVTAMTPATQPPPGAGASAPVIVQLANGATFNLTASMVKKTLAGHEVSMLAYNGSIPGPTIKVPKGAEITIHFTNQTNIATTLHSHGVRLDNAFDGVPDVTQPIVGTGASFDYKIKFPDEGVYWYHPHVREDYAQALGLFGNYLVVPDRPDYWSPVNQEVPLMVSDILLTNGVVASFGSVANHVLMGRFGNTMLANGSDHYTLAVKQGEVVRFYFTNTANTRVFNLTIPGVKIKRVGGDNGRYERETFVDSVLLSPSERAIVEVLFDTPGVFPLQHKTPQKTYLMGNINVSADKAAVSYAAQFQQLRANGDVTAGLAKFRPDFDKPAAKSLVLTVDMPGMDMSGMNMGTMMMGDRDKIEWEDSMAMMNQMATAKTVQWKITDRATGKSGMDIDWKFKVGDRVKIKIFNDPASLHAMQHPIHFHGQRFLVLTTNGVKTDNFVWKDTTLIQKGDTVEILVDMENPGTWMAHCHIAEHLESGMMFNFRVNSAVFMHN